MRQILDRERMWGKIELLFLRTSLLYFYLVKTATMFWQALNKIGYNDYVEWISGKALTYTDWGAGEPAAFATENCVGIE
jgi:hypothetical protein